MDIDSDLSQYSKANIRQKAKLILNELDLKDCSSQLCQAIQQHIYYQRSQHVMIYQTLPDEIDISELRDISPEKNFYLPGMDQGYIAPVPEIRVSLLDLIIIPGLAFDQQGYRLGRGGGHYDRFLSDITNDTYTLGVISRELYVERLPSEIHDIRVHEVITI